MSDVRCCHHSRSATQSCCLSSWLSSCAVWDILRLSDICWCLLIQPFSCWPGGARGFTFHCFCWHCADLEWESEYFFKDCRQPCRENLASPRFILSSPTLPPCSQPHLFVYLYDQLQVCVLILPWMMVHRRQLLSASWLVIREFHGSHKPSQTSKPAAYVAGVEEWLYDVRLLWRREETSLQEDLRAMNENMAQTREEACTI